ncbi:MAG: V-type ATP synthase subunit B [Nitrococcus mobilis]|nr:V-type ATP synthase subunit B [Nitrococcus mobilis]
MTQTLARYTQIVSIIGDILQVRVPNIGEGWVRPRLHDLAFTESQEGERSLAQIIRIDQEVVSLQVFSGTEGLSTAAGVRFIGRPMEVTCSANIMGRVFDSTGRALDIGPDLAQERKVPIGGPTVNPMRRVMPSKMIRTGVPMIDVFNSLVESQKIPVFSVAGEPYNALLARIAVQADADAVVFGGLGLIFDDYHFFRTQFEEAGVFARTVMFVNQASDPVIERLLVPDMALTVAERLAVEEGRRVLVLLTDMTAFADALKEVGISLERVPSNRGYMGDLYSQLARRYEKACDFKGAGSVTILSATTMPGDDITHPVPDNTGYITEGQFYLHGGLIDPFGSLSRLKQHVVGKVTREDHGQVMNAMVRFYAEASDAEHKESMAFELSEYDRRLLRFARLFRERFMDASVSMPLEQALGLCWQTMAECFTAEELLIKQSLVDKYFPESEAEGESSAQAGA